jgi:hypothetical protein
MPTPARRPDGMPLTDPERAEPLTRATLLLDESE